MKIQSMTGFARTQRQWQNHQITWEIRSVNHRNLDIHLRLPEVMRAHEANCRELISQQIQRGRIDASLHIESVANAPAEQSIDIAAVKQLKQHLQQIENIMPNSVAPNALQILQWPGILISNDIDEVKLQEHSDALLQQCVSALLDMRSQEGEKIHHMIHSRLIKCRELTQTLQHNIGAINQQVMQNFKKRASQFEHNLEEHRLAQEMAILMTRVDVSEELDRLLTHYDEIERLISHADNPVGRRLDFLMQELNREANTLGSKASDIELTNIAVELKVLIDQMREQIQNLQ